LEPSLPAFHWEIEFPEVFLETATDGSIRRRQAGGFDVMVGNPPFAGKNTIAEGHPTGYLDWLKTVHPQSHGNADLVAHFFRRVFNLIRQDGAFGLIATNTIGQGDTRSTGLRWICNHGGTIYAARKRLRWPGDAAVVVSVVHVHKGPLAGPYDVDGRAVNLITAYLFHTGGNDDPARLHASAGKSFVGSYVLGMGFTFDDTDKKGVACPVTKTRADELARSGDRPISMEELIAEDPRNQERIFPYIGGKEVNDSPTQAHHRYVINFEQMSEAEARRWPGLMNIVEDKVKGTRASHSTAEWWHFERFRPELYNSIGELERVLVCGQTSKYRSFLFLPSDMVYDQKLIVFVPDLLSQFALLQSRVHLNWSQFMGSSMKDDPVYTPSDCYETFPFPDGWSSRPELDSVGKGYYEFRAQLMRESNKGLTKTYNRFHDPKEKSPEIRQLRELHLEMDLAVLAAYGWTNIDTTCGFDLDWCEAEPADDASPDTLERIETGWFFFETAEEARAFAAELEDGGKSLGWRYRWRPEIRDDVLARLLLLNAQRAEEERQAGLSPLPPASGEDDDEVGEDHEDDDELSDDED